VTSTVISFVVITSSLRNGSRTGVRETIYHESLPCLKARLTRTFAANPSVHSYTIRDSTGQWERRRGDRGWTFTPEEDSHG